MAGEWKNKLFFGDNLSILREQVAEESVDLIYLEAGAATHKRAQRQSKSKAEQGGLFSHSANPARPSNPAPLLEDDTE